MLTSTWPAAFRVRLLDRLHAGNLPRIGPSTGSTAARSGVFPRSRGRPVSDREGRIPVRCRPEYRSPWPRRGPADGQAPVGGRWSADWIHVLGAREAQCHPGFPWYGYRFVSGKMWQSGKPFRRLTRGVSQTSQVMSIVNGTAALPELRMRSHCAAVCACAHDPVKVAKAKGHRMRPRRKLKSVSRHEGRAPKVLFRHAGPAIRLRDAITGPSAMQAVHQRCICCSVR